MQRKVLMSIQTMKVMLKKNKIDEEEGIDEKMDIDGGNEWIEANRRKQKRRILKKKVVIDDIRMDEHFKCHSCGKDYKTQAELDDHRETHSRKKSISCGKCYDLFDLQSELNDHEKTHTGMKPYKCQMCELSFELLDDLKVHLKTHRLKESFTCGKCDDRFDSGESFKEHEKSHGKIVTEFKCQNCEKIYSSMVKLRRHDWRSHRVVPCNICDETIDSRQDISNHRQSKHQIFRKVMCRFFPACLDEDECFFFHDPSFQKKANEEKPSPFCPMGQNCSNQSCEYSESNHKDRNGILCRFQADCIRKFCSFKHSVERRAFLEESRQSQRRT